MLQLRTSFCQSHRERGRNPVGNTADEGERAARWKDSNRKEKYRGQRALDHAKQLVYSIPNSFKALSQPHNQQHTQSYLNTFSVTSVSSVKAIVTSKSRGAAKREGQEDHLPQD